MTEADAKAIIYGVAIGDALGWPIELMKMDKIQIIYGERGIQEPPDPARISDETQTTEAVIKALIDAGDEDVDGIMKALTHHLIEWSQSPENNRAPGHTLTEAVRTMEAGISWRESGLPQKGNGSVVRIAPVGYFFQHDLEKLKQVSIAVGLATHTHPTAVAACVAAAYLVKLGLDEVPVDQFTDRILAITRDMDEEFGGAVRKIGHVMGWTDEMAALNYIGAGWMADEAVAMAMYSVMKHPDNFARAVSRSVNTAGDSDSVGAVAGAVSAAVTGLEGIPPEWINRLENFDRLTELAEKLAKKRLEVFG
ncbi:MAG: hypothetical protein GYB68_01650 [Chloroflexi bacterium]|nr:hypothetical protein [Chloroflexota bacterium]